MRSETKITAAVLLRRRRRRTPESKITQSKLFPFVKAVKPLEYESYVVYAGDCEANNPETVTAAGEKLKSKSVQVTPGGSIA